ncbi:MAG: HAMP domain-containing sensor histidine kinase [Sphingorhabdus sp.]
MTGTSILAQPITGEVAIDGRLLRADPQLLGMQFAAGGEEGGLLAIPALLNIARLTARLKMGLARSVVVADAHECAELWVESYWANGVAHLSILSSKPVNYTSDQDASRDAEIDWLGGDFEAEVDADGRLIGLTGDFPPDYDHAHIGFPIDGMFMLDANQREEWENGWRAERAFDLKNVQISKLDSRYLMESRPLFHRKGELAGYRLSFSPCGLEPGANENAGGAQAGKRQILFGRELGSVLRQPLGRIIANAETIGVKLQGPLRDNYAVYAKDIASAAKHLVALVDDLGDLEAVEQPDFETALDDIELGDVARRVRGLLALKAADHRIDIITPDENEKVPAVAEFRRVLQIMLNLVNNAIRYSPDGSKVVIDIAKLNDVACITVTDQGDGIAVEDREKAFEKFERLGRSGDGGSGLGLYISRRLAVAMRGDLRVSDARDGGALFALTLPAG